MFRIFTVPRSLSRPPRFTFMPWTFVGMLISFPAADIVSQPSSGPLHVPTATGSSFEPGDLGPVEQSATDNNQQSGFEADMHAAIANLREDWEFAADIQIQEEAGRVTGWRDFFHENPEYRDYVVKSMELEKSSDLEAWRIAAFEHLQAGRESHAGHLSRANLHEIEDLLLGNLRVAASGDGRELDRANERWVLDHATAVQEGLYQFQTAFAALQQDRDTFMRELDETEAVFHGNLATIDDYEHTVRAGIQSSSSMLRAELWNNDLFFHESFDRTGAMTVDRSRLNASGRELRAFLDRMDTALGNGAPITVLTDALAKYLERQIARATTERDHWAAKIRGTSVTPMAASIARDGRETHIANGRHGCYRDIQPAIFGAGAHFTNIPWHAIKNDALLSGFMSYAATGDTSGLNAFLEDAGEFRVIEGYGADTRLCGDGVGASHTWSTPMGGFCTNGSIREEAIRSGHKHAKVGHDYHRGHLTPSWQYAFLYIEPSICCSEIVSKGLGHGKIKNQSDFTAWIHYDWHDPNAEANRDTYQRYIDQLSGLQAHWRDELLPSIEKWEAQAARYRADHADWKSRADANRARMEAEFRSGAARLARGRNQWLARVSEHRRAGARDFAHLEIHLPRAQLTGSNDTAFLDRARQGIPDHALILGTRESIQRGLRAAFNGGQINAMQYQAKMREQRTLRRVAERIEAHANPLSAPEAEEGLGQFYTEITEDGVRAVRYIHSGKATQIEGAKGTDENDYHAEYEEETISFSGPTALQLAGFEDIFAFENKSREFKENVAEYTHVEAGTFRLLDAQLTGATATAHARQRMFADDRARQIQEARAHDAKFKKPFGGFFDSVMMSMLGGAELNQAVTSSMQQQATSRIANDLGLEALQSLIGGMVSGQGFDDALAGATDAVVDDFIADESGVDLTIVSGLRDGQSFEEVGAAYVERMFYQNLEEMTNITGLAAFLKGQKAKKAAEKEKQKQMQDTAVTVAAVAAGPFTGGASLYALAAYKAVEGYKTGGTNGALAGGAGGLVTAATGGSVNVNLTYDERNGLEGDIGMGIGEATVGISYSKEGGYGANAGINLGDAATFGVSYNATQGLGANIALSGLPESDLEGFGLNLSYSEHGGASGSLGITDKGSGIKSSLTYTPTDGFGVDFSYSGSSKDFDYGGNIGFTQHGGTHAGVTAGWKGIEGVGSGLGTAPWRPEGFNEDFDGAGGGLSWNQRDGVRANIDIAGTNAFNWNDTEGWSGNADYENSYFDKERIKHIKKIQEQRRREAKFKADAATEGIRAKLFENPNLTPEQRTKLERMTPAELHELATSTPGALVALHAAGYTFDASGSRDNDSWWDRNFGAYTDYVLGSLGTASNDLVREENGEFKIRTCFVAGTLVLTSTGPKPIEQIKAHDLVYAYNEKTGKLAWYPVIQTFVRITPEIHHLKLSNGANLSTTWSHKFYVAGKGWVQTEDLKVGDLIHTPNSLSKAPHQSERLKMAAFATNTGKSSLARPRGPPAQILEHRVEAKEETVFNFTVKDAHSYFVGGHNQWVLTHNSPLYAVPALKYAPAIIAACTGPQAAGCLVAGGVIAVTTAGTIAYYQLTDDGELVETERPPELAPGQLPEQRPVSPLIPQTETTPEISPGDGKKKETSSEQKKTTESTERDEPEKSGWTEWTVLPDFSKYFTIFSSGPDEQDSPDKDAKPEPTETTEERSGANDNKRKGKKRGPKTDPNAPHNRAVREEADKLENEGNTIEAGGKREKEQLIQTPGGIKSGRRPDITYQTPDGKIKARNVGKKKKDGSPIKREKEALDDLNGPGGIETDFAPYN